ncbi:hypothetical protein PLICRDRAFT_47058 [Plicaturopsis crispa FD-325 SS-3]|uniref:Uncharacterized protein n=1 Tax=Plicaturopsis crispa FD-325 SS-3 TaxID=944288 RepID=A0A0C9SWB2_PLICR|nr:hypothetical protein PLICRDRAFT_47058 [Plicaturopsis crispa FD-325 SS-3]
MRMRVELAPGRLSREDDRQAGIWLPSLRRSYLSVYGILQRHPTMASLVIAQSCLRRRRN